MKQFLDANSLSRPVKMHPARANLLNRVWEKLEADTANASTIPLAKLLHTICEEIFAGLDPCWFKLCENIAAFFSMYHKIPECMKDLMNNAQVANTFIKLRARCAVNIMAELTGPESFIKGVEPNIKTAIEALSTEAVLDHVSVIDCSLVEKAKWIEAWQDILTAYNTQDVTPADITKDLIVDLSNKFGLTTAEPEAKVKLELEESEAQTAGGAELR